MENKSLTPRQLSALLWASMLAPLVRQVPGAMLPDAGGSAWLSAGLTIPAAGLLSALLGRLLRARRPGESPEALLRRLLGGPVACVLGGASGLWLCFCAGFTLRAGADRLVAAVYPESPAGLFAALMLLLCLPAARGELRTLGRMAELTGPLLLALFALVSALALPQTEFGALWSKSAGPRELGAGALPLLGTVSAGGFFLLLWGDETGERPGRVFFFPLLGLSVTAMSLCALTVGSFGPALCGELRYPFFVLLRNLQLPHLLERGEALVAAAWVISDYLLTGTQLHMASRALGLVRRSGDAGPGTVLPAAALAALAAALCGPDPFTLERLGRELIPLVDLGAAFLLLPGVLIIGKIRKKP